MIDVKLIKKPKQGGPISSSGGGTFVNNTDPAAHADYADRAGKADKATRAEQAAQADYAKHAVYAERAAYADAAERLAKDSEVYEQFLRKDQADTARELITFLKGIVLGEGKYSIDGEGKAKLLSLIVTALQSADYDSLSETGFGFEKRKDGKYRLSLTDLTVWGKAVFHELEIRKLSYVGGNMVFSACGSRIIRVQMIGTDGNTVTDAAVCTAYRCYFYQDDGTTATTNLWKVDDQARCQSFNIKPGVYQNVSNKAYWRRVVAVGDDYIDLSAGDCESGSDIPAPEDAIVQMGNRTQTDRQSLIYVIVTGDDAPAIVWYDGVNSYTLADRQTAVISPKKVYFSAKIFKIVSGSGTTVPVAADRGAWQPGVKYAYYDRVSHNGSLWLCVAPEGTSVTSEPAEGNPHWQKQVSAGQQGESPLTLTILSDRGNIIRNGQGKVTLMALVFRGSEDVTDSYPATAFSWTRNSGNAEYDKAWNRRHERIGKSITVNAEDIWKKAVFECVLSD